MKITLKAARVNVGLTQNDVAEALGTSKKTIWNWENGIGFPNKKEHLDGLCKLYGVAYDDLIFLPTKNA